MKKFVKVGHLFDGTGAKTQDNVVVAIEDEKIVAVGADVEIPDVHNFILDRFIEFRSPSQCAGCEIHE